jgi:hypothetical protein
VVQIVGHAAFAAGDVKGHARPHDRPARPGAGGDGEVDLLHRGLAVGHHVEGLAPQGLLEPGRDEARQFPLHDERRLADQAVEVGRPGDRLRRRPFAADHLHQRQQVGRVEGVGDHGALRRRTASLNIGHREARGAGGDHHLGRYQLAQHFVKRLLKSQVLGHALLDEIRFGAGLRQVGRAVKIF